MKANYIQSINCPYEKYYVDQAGSGIGPVYKGASFQKGHGIGSFLKGLFRTIFPLVKNGVSTLGKEAIRSGVGFLSDMVHMKPVDESIKQRFREASGNLKRKADEKVDNLLSGSGYKKKKKISNNIINSKSLKKNGLKQKKNKKYFSDIFCTKRSKSEDGFFT